MNFNKIGLVALSTAAIFMATSCNKSQTLKLEDAKAWVDKHYTKGFANPKSGKVIYDFSNTSGEEARIYIVEMLAIGGIDLNEDLKYENDMTKEVLSNVPNLSSDDPLFDETTWGDKLPKYIVTNGAMTIKYATKAVPGYDATAVAAYNTKGGPTKIATTIGNVKVDGINGTINGTIKLTYKY